MSSADFSRSFTFLPRLGWKACTFLYAWLSFGGIAQRARSAEVSTKRPVQREARQP